MRILLTGATGFIGSAFLRQALAASHSVAGLIRPGQAGRRAVVNADRDIGELPHSKISWLQGTLSEAPWGKIEAFAPDTCVHTAWISTPGVYLDSPENQRHVEWSLNFLRRAVELGVRHILVLGTCIEYRMTGAPLSEDRTPLEPATVYARAKHELHARLEAELAGRSVSLGWARVFYPYGPGEHPARLCSSIVKSLRCDQPVTLKTPDSRKDYIYIEDLARALVLLTGRKFSGAVNLGVGEDVSVRLIAELLGQAMGKPDLIRFPERPIADPLDCVVADSSKLRSLGWKPEVNLETGLAKLVNAIRGMD